MRYGRSTRQRRVALRRRRDEAASACLAGRLSRLAQLRRAGSKADLKPLYNYVQDCRECQLRLAAANLNLADDAKRIAALTTERDAAVTAAKGGTLWSRMRRNLLWFAVGAAAATAYNAKR